MAAPTVKEATSVCIAFVMAGGEVISSTNPLPVTSAGGGGSGTVAVSNFPATQVVSGSAAVGTPPVTPPLAVSGVDGAGNKQHLLLDTAGRLNVNVNGTIGVSGSFWQATQPVSGTLAVSNFPATQPVSAAALPLPTGAATAANQVAALPTGGNVIGVVVPAFNNGGMIAQTTAAGGTTFTAFASQACKQLTIANNTGVTIEVQQAGAGVALPIFPGAYFTFFGIANASTFGIRRVDQSTTVVTVQARWET